MSKTETSNFKRLIGVWTTSGQIISGTDTQSLTGTDSYEVILDGNFILHKANVMMGNEKSETAEIIGQDNSSGEVTMNYFNSKGESGVMTGEIENNDFRIDGDKIRFVGKINTENTEVVGKWFSQAEDKSWNEFIDLKLEKRS